MKKLIFLVLSATIFFACSNDDVIENPNEIDLENLWINAKQGSFWKYSFTNKLSDGTVETLNLAVPLNFFKMDKDSLIGGKNYKMIGIDNTNGTLQPVFIFTLEDKKLLQPFDKDLQPDAQDIVHTTVIDFNKQIGEVWRNDLFENEYELIYIDSVGMDYRGFENVIKTVKQSYNNEELTSTRRTYYKTDIGIISKIALQEISQIETDENLYEYNVEF